MEIDDIPTVTADLSISEAFERVVRSRRSALLVHSDDKIQLFSAEALHAGTKSKPEAPVEQLGRIAGAPDLLAEHVELLAVRGDRASLRFSSKLTFDAMNTAVGIYKCSATPTHSFYDWDLKKLTKNANGDYLCDVDLTVVS